MSEIEKKDNEDSEVTKENTKETEAANKETVTTKNDSEHSESVKEDSEDSSVASTPLSSPSKSSDQSSITLSPNNSSPQSSLTRGKAPKMASVPVVGVRGAGAALGQESSNGGRRGFTLYPEVAHFNWCSVCGIQLMYVCMYNNRDPPILAGGGHATSRQKGL